MKFKKKKQMKWKHISGGRETKITTCTKSQSLVLALE